MEKSIILGASIGAALYVDPLISVTGNRIASLTAAGLIAGYIPVVLWQKGGTDWTGGLTDLRYNFPALTGAGAGLLAGLLGLNPMNSGLLGLASPFIVKFGAETLVGSAWGEFDWGA